MYEFRLRRDALYVSQLVSNAYLNHGKHGRHGIKTA